MGWFGSVALGPVKFAHGRWTGVGFDWACLVFDGLGLVRCWLPHPVRPCSGRYPPLRELGEGGWSCRIEAPRRFRTPLPRQVYFPAPPTSFCEQAAGSNDQDGYQTIRWHDHHHPPNLRSGGYLPGDGLSGFGIRHGARPDPSESSVFNQTRRTPTIEERTLPVPRPPTRISRKAANPLSPSPGGYPPMPLLPPLPL